MNIYADEGDQVWVTEETKNNGYDSDKEKVSKYLDLDKKYTVKRTVVHNWSTDVFLVEVPDISFNSTSFLDETDDPFYVEQEFQEIFKEFKKEHLGEGKLSTWKGIEDAFREFYFIIKEELDV